jgi:aerobic carbon-monoxide dehydrogenase medium subunit
VKPAPFRYVQARSLDEAISALEELGEEAKILAGGQSLLPMMNFRLARPEALVDIGGVVELSGVRTSGDQLTIGALTRHHDLERCTVTGPLGSLLRQSAAHVGHLPIRTRGTFGGSVAHADPSAEWCLLSTLLDASVTAVSSAGSRQIPAATFFQTYYSTSLAPNEVLTEVRLPVLGDEHRTGIVEFARRAGDFAVVAAMVDCRVVDGSIEQARVCLGGVADRAVRSLAAEQVLSGRLVDDAAAFREAGEAAAENVSPAGDIHGSGAYRRDLVRVLVQRALERMAP